jgi:hypothetical protein
MQQVPGNTMQVAGATPAEYDQLAAELLTLGGTKQSLDALQSFYQDPKERLQELKNYVKQLRAENAREERRKQAYGEQEQQGAPAKPKLPPTQFEQPVVADAAPPAPAEVEKPTKHARQAHARQHRASRIRDVQARARAKTAVNGQDPNYKDGGYRPMPNLFSTAFVAAMPGPVAKAYIVACQLAEDDGSFEISHATLSERIGSRYRSHGERAMRRLVDAGLIDQRWRGGPGRPNGYRLASLARLDVETAKAVLDQPLTVDGKAKKVVRENGDG